jgi:hypothetical protein
MSNYRIIARSPCRITLNNKVRTFKANDSFIANEQEKDRLMRGMYRRKLIVVGQVEDKEKVYETTERKDKEQEKVDEQEDDDRQEEEEVDRQETNILSSEESFEARLERKGLPHPSISQNAHWATVKSKVQDLEQQVPIPLNMIRAIKEKFSNYKAVVEECDRILSENEED